MANYYFVESTTGAGRLGAQAGVNAYCTDLFGDFVAFDFDRWSGIGTDGLARKRAGLTSHIAAATADFVLNSQWWVKIDGVDTAILKGDDATWPGANDNGAGAYEPHGSPDDRRDMAVWGPVGAAGSDAWWAAFYDFSGGSLTVRFQVAVYDGDGRTPATFDAQIGCRIDGAIHGVERCGLLDPAGRWLLKVHRDDATWTPGDIPDRWITPGPGADSGSPSLRLDGITGGVVGGSAFDPETIVHGPSALSPWDLEGGAFDEGDTAGTDTALYIRWPSATLSGTLNPMGVTFNLLPYLIGGTAGNRVGSMGGAPLA